MRVLLLEDDLRLRQAYGRRLRAEGYAVDEVTTIAQAREAFYDAPYCCAVLDRLVPDGDSIELVGDMRAEGSRPSLLVLSGLEAGESRIEGLEAGADDYVAKPVALDELALRVRKLVIRRSSAGARVTVGRVSMDRARRVVSTGGTPVHLTPKQYAVLEQLMIDADHVVDHELLLERCWDAQRDPFSDPLHSQITRLRSIFHDDLVIESARGSGYMLRARAAGG